jgi:hypothetical protein
MTDVTLEQDIGLLVLAGWSFHWHEPVPGITRSRQIVAERDNPDRRSVSRLQVTCRETWQPADESRSRGDAAIQLVRMVREHMAQMRQLSETA